MYTLNLVYPEKSDIKYKIVKFSDSQIQFTLDDPESVYGEAVKILSRNSWNDVQVILAATAALNEAGVGILGLYIPYFLGARSDRKFSEGGVNYLREVICPIINEQGYDWLEIMDPHSDVLEGCLHNFNKTDNVVLVQWAFDQISTIMEDIVIVSPDAGAIKKIDHVAKELSFTGEIITASKCRDIQTGKILSTKVPIDLSHSDKDFVIIDDICDGGRTFIEIAKVIKGAFSNAKIYLIVTHGIFSAGFDELNKYFDDIFCTNSVWDNDNVKYSEGDQPRLPKQLNVF